MTTTESVRPTEADIKALLEAGCHFGHQTKRWNPKMKPYIFGVRNGIHVINLDRTWEGLQAACAFLNDTVARGKQVLFVGTKKQAQEIIRTTAESVGQPYVVNRWLGGMLTNNRTVRQSVARMERIEAMEKSGEMEKLPKKEVSALRHELAKLQKSLGGVKGMNGLPSALFVVDVCREKLAVDEAVKLHIPVVAMVDTNAANVKEIDYVIPCNDDAIRSIACIVGRIGQGLQEAAQEFERTAADIARQRSMEDAEAKARQTAIDEQRKARDREQRKARAEAMAKAKAAVKPAEAPAPEAAAPEKAEAPAADAPAPEAQPEA